MSPVITVAAREIVERARSKAFVVSNVIILLAIAAGAVVPALMPESEPAKVAVFDEASRMIVRATGEMPARASDELAVLDVADREEAEEAVLSGDADVALIDGTTVIAEDEPSDDVLAALQGPIQARHLEEMLAASGLTSMQLRSIMTPVEIDVVALDPSDDEDAGMGDEAFVVALVGVVLLYSLLVLYGQWVAQGIVEEKQSRVIEVLLSSVTPMQLLSGKVVGIGLLGMAQIAFIAALGAGGAVYALDIALPPGAWTVIAVVLAWYVLGFAIYATLFAMVGALCARVEDLQSAAMPVFILIFGAIFSVNLTLANPEGPLAQAVGLVPFTAPLAQPILIATGAATVAEMLLAVVLGLVTVALLIPLTARMYSGGVLKTGSRISIKDAWGAGSKT